MRDFRREHPHLKTVVTEDGLYAAGKHLQVLEELDLKFIITAKPGNLRLLYDGIESSMLTEVVRCHAGVTQRYRFLNQVPLNDTFFEKKVNFLEYDDINARDNKQYFAWITDLPLSESTLETVMRVGRARWRIENETFNTLKNQGYEMGHNDGHGHQHLCSNLGLLILLAFLIDSLSELSDQSFQRAKASAKSYRVLWEEVRAVFKFFMLESFEGLYLKILPEHRYNSS